MRITSKFPGKCSVCSRDVEKGEPVEWERGKGVTCRQCARLSGKVVVPARSTAPVKCQWCKKLLEAGTPYLTRDVNVSRYVSVMAGAMSMGKRATHYCIACVSQVNEENAQGRVSEAADYLRDAMNDTSEHGAARRPARVALAAKASASAAFLRSHSKCFDPRRSAPCMDGVCGASTATLAAIEERFLAALRSELGLDRGDKLTASSCARPSLV